MLDLENEKVPGRGGREGGRERTRPRGRVVSDSPSLGPQELFSKQKGYLDDELDFRKQSLDQAHKVRVVMVLFRTPGLAQCPELWSVPRAAWDGMGVQQILCTLSWPQLPHGQNTWVSVALAGLEPER